MKKAFSFLLILALCFGLCACGQENILTTTEPEPEDPTASVPSVLLPYLDALYGHWILSPGEDADLNPYTALKVRQDGTCEVDGMESTWEFDAEHSNNTNLFIRIYRGAEHICGAQISRSPAGSIYFFRAMDVPFIFCPGVWKKAES